MSAEESGIFVYKHYNFLLFWQCCLSLFSLSLLHFLFPRLLLHSYVIYVSGGFSTDLLFSFLPFFFFFSQQSKRRSQGLSLDSIYHCLNRTILYQLSRPHKTVPQQVTLLDSLRVLTVNRNLVLGPGNHDQEFVACLAHCLINLHTGRWERHGVVRCF